MKKKIIMVVCLFMVCFLATSGYVGTMSAQPAQAASSLKETQSKLDKLKDEQKKLEEELEKAQSEKDASLDKKQKTEQLLITLEVKIGELNNYISSLSGEVSTLENDIVAAQAEYDETYEKFKKRVRASYENGQTSYLEALLTSDDFSDFLSKYEYISSVMQYDKDLLETLKNKIDEINADKAQKEDMIAKQQSALSDQEAAKKKQEQKQKDLDNEISKLENNVQLFTSQSVELRKEEEKLDAEIQKLMDKQKVYNGNGFIWPLETYSYISSNFGYRTFDNQIHDAVDIAAPAGTAIYAVADGKVIYSDYTNTGGGNKIVIDHGSGLSTTYCHCSARLVSAGTEVKQGQIIAKVGKTGTATGNHLHFRVAVNGKAVDPIGAGYISVP